MLPSVSSQRRETCIFMVFKHRKCTFLRASNQQLDNLEPFKPSLSLMLEGKRIVVLCIFMIFLLIIIWITLNVQTFSKFVHGLEGK